MLRDATLDDLELLRYWDTLPHVIASDPDDDWEWEKELGRNPEWRVQLMAVVEGKPIGFVQIIDPAEEESHYWGEIGSGYRAIDIWIGPEEYLGKGFGTAMMHLAIERCFRDAGVHSILIDPLKSNTGAIRFYKRLGFRFLEDRRFGDSICEVYQLSRTDYMT